MAANLYEGIPELEQGALENERRRKIAEAMFAQAQQPVTPYTSDGRFVVPMHFTQGLAQLMQAYVARKGLKKAEAKDEELAGQKRQMAADALTKYERERALPPETLEQTRRAPDWMPQPVDIRLEGLTERPEDALISYVSNQAVPESARVAEQMRFAADMRAKESAAAREARSADVARAFEERKALEQEKASDRVDLEQMRIKADEAAQRRDAALRRELAENRNAPPAPKKDYRYTPTGDLEVTPGSETAHKFAKQRAAEDTARTAVISMVDAELKNIDQLIGTPETAEKAATSEHPGLDSATGPIEARYIPTIRKKTADAEALIESLQAKESIRSLRDIRSLGSQSIGSLTEREWPRLESMKVALQRTQSKEQFVKQLKEYREELLRLKAETERAYSQLDEAPSATTGSVDGWVDVPL